MNQLATITHQNNRLLVAGDLVFSTIMPLWEQSLVLCQASKELHFDLTQVKLSNSAGLALIIGWIKYAKQFNKPISFSHIPEQLKSIVAAAGIGKMVVV
ncbi:MAG: STAS domain-containing protein [Gammaproteobacteria bacterium]